MELFTSIVVPVVTLVVIFLFSIQKFSRQVSIIAGEGFKRAVSSATKTPLRGMLSGMGFTALVQSSTATTVILVGMVDAGLITFAHSLGVIVGANIGSTITSQLVALETVNIAPAFVLLGFIIHQLGGAYKKWGKPIFYFGLLFFTLSLISFYIEPIKNNPAIISIFSGIDTVYAGILVGLIFTAIVQSSGVASGLVVILVASGILNIEQGVAIILGANIGTTATALIVSLTLGENAKKAAVAHLLFNVIGVLLFLPFIRGFTDLVSLLGGSSEQVVANTHLIFNILSAIVALIFLKFFERMVEKVAARA